MGRQADGTGEVAEGLVHARVLVIGEALVDIVQRDGIGAQESPGGSSANVALTLGRLGRPSILLTALGADERGERIRAWLDASGVRVLAGPLERTSTASAVLSADGSATYEFDLHWRLDAVHPPRAGIVHSGSLAALLEPGASQVRGIVTAMRPEALVTYDPNIRPALLPDPQAARQAVLAAVASADLVKASDEDMSWLHPGEDPVEVARRWLATGPAVVVITRGAQGAVAVSRSGEVRVAAPTTAVVDTVGAGDSFMGALIDGLIDTGLADASAREALHGVDGATLEALLQFAVATAAVTVSRPGADPPRRAEIMAL